VKPTFRMKCPSRRLSTPPPAQCTMNASRMMARMTMTIQMKNSAMPGMAYPATDLALATGPQLPGCAGFITKCPPVLDRDFRHFTGEGPPHRLEP
jgi:hypothetical protein